MKNVFYSLALATGLMSCNENTGQPQKTPNEPNDTTQQTTEQTPKHNPVNPKLKGLDLSEASVDVELAKDQMKGYTPESGFGAFLSKMTEVVEVRDDQDEVEIYNVIIKDKTGKEIARLGETVGVSEEGIRFLNNGMLEVGYSDTYYADGSDGFSKILKGGPLYTYFGVNADGQFNKLESNRVFDCTEFTKIDESYIKQEFTLPADKEGVSDQYQYYRTHQYLCEEGISYMINEIYASYGYKFKKEKWQKIFEGYDWYQPTKDDVNSDFTDIDKHNIQFLKDAREKLKGNEAAMLQEKLEKEFMAG
ncbi:MAG: YARHG domain-containing protein [Aureispira sp.]|nr:YARHG domain-containing protein [Aureispira sp.]